MCRRSIVNRWEDISISVRMGAAGCQPLSRPLHPASGMRVCLRRLDEPKSA